MIEETPDQKTARIIGDLNAKYPGKKCFDVDGRGTHFVCEVEPAFEHPEYDKSAEIIILSRAHKFENSAQTYTVLRGSLELHVGEDVLVLDEGNSYEIAAGITRWAQSENECLVEIISKPGKTEADRVILD